MTKGTLYVVSAPSGGGKTSLVKALLGEDPQCCASVSYTSRPKRPGEQDGQNYHFVDKPTFLSLEAKGAFLESAKVFGCHYGTSKEAVKAKLNKGLDVILVIDWQGAALVRAKVHCVSIFILPPSLEALKVRLLEREEDDEVEIEKRMALAEREISHYSEYDYVVVNDVFEDALSDLRAIFRAERLKISKFPAQDVLK